MQCGNSNRVRYLGYGVSWEDLQAILKEAREEALKERTKTLVDCPQCGTLLEWRDGIANCPMGDYRSAGGIRGSVRT